MKTLDEIIRLYESTLTIAELEDHLLGICPVCNTPVMSEDEYRIEARSSDDIHYSHWTCLDEAEIPFEIEDVNWCPFGTHDLEKVEDQFHCKNCPYWYSEANR